MGMRNSINLYSQNNEKTVMSKKRGGGERGTRRKGMPLVGRTRNVAMFNVPRPRLCSGRVYPSIRAVSLV